MKVAIEHLGVVYTRNITPDVESGIGSWTAADLRRVLREGRTRNGRVLNPLDMPWIILADLTDADIDAIHIFLQSLPAARNHVPSPEAPGWSDAVVGKLRTLLTGRLIGAGYHPGNHGVADGTTAEMRNPRAPVVAFACSMALLFLALLIVMRRPRSVECRVSGETVRRGRLLAAIALVFSAGLFLYSWPLLDVMPLALLSAKPPYDTLGRWLSLPPLRPAPNPVGLETEDDLTFARRGQYVAALGTCALCHTAGPNLPRLYRPFPDLGGGMKVNWKVFGTVYARNLTPHRETGLGAWSNDEIRRAIVSGIARDGRLMHWQAMPWDHFSNLSLEDLEALIFYLRHLPPVFSKVPDPLPPQPGDAEADTFYFGYSGDYRPGG
jgi:hypothetical protein